MEPEAILCPPYAMGYSIDRKDWCRFFVDHIRPIKLKENVWENLVLDTDQKEVLQALVDSHRYQDDPRNQPEQKGKGFVVLLHGSPGSGQTLTAEIAAEGSQKALVMASMSDLNPHNK
jgi:SpoVK/Ycf46/Vps4 family AAA+-type ATPase